MAAPLLEVRDLKTHFFTEDGITRAVDGVSFEIGAGETLGIVGRVGLRQERDRALDPAPAARPDRPHRGAARVRFDGIDLLALSEAEMRDIRGNRIAMIFQEPMTSLNPVLTIGHQIAEALRVHKGFGRSEAREHARRMLEVVRIPDAQSRLDDYPHQFSGGMRQRVMIAMALACSPKLLIADEPTTALDVTIQAQVLKLILELKEQTGAAVILITHDLGVVAETCQRVVVMYAGRKVEEASVLELFDRPAHPYTRGLLALDRARPGRRTRQAAAGDPGHRAVAAGSRLPAAHSRPAAATRSIAATARRRRCRKSAAAKAAAHLAACFLAAEPGGVMTAEATSSAGKDPTARMRPVRPRGRRPQEILSRAARLLQRTRAEIRAVDGVSFTLEPGETLCLVGESGSGKSTVGRLVLRLIEPTDGQSAPRWSRHHPPQPRGDASLAQAHADRVPGPLCLAQPAPDRGPHRRRAARELPGWRGLRSRRAGRPNCSSASA